MRCILAYAYRNLNNYKQSHLYLNEAIKLKITNPIAYYLRGEIYFRQNKYHNAIVDLNTSVFLKLKVNNLFVILGNIYLVEEQLHRALENYNLVLHNNPNNYICLKLCAYIYYYQGKHSSALEMLDKLLSINQE